MFYPSFTAWPEMFAYPYLVNHGFNLFQDIAQPYQPLLTLFLAGVYRLFGYQLAVLEVVTWLIILINCCLLIWLSLKVMGRSWRVLIPLVFYLLSVGLLEGNALWFDLGSTPFVLLGLVCLRTNWPKTKQLFGLGIGLSLAFLVKQQQAILMAWGGLFWLVSERWRSRSYWLGVLGPMGIVIVAVSLMGVLSDYLFWTVKVPLFWYPQMPGYVHLPTTRQLVQLGLLFGPGVVIGLWRWPKSDQLERLVLGLVMVSGLLALPRFELFRLQTTLIVYAVLLISLVKDWSWRSRLALVVVVFGVIWMWRDLIRVAPQPVRFYDQATIEMAQRVAAATRPSERVYLLGVSSLVYVLADRLPSKPWVDNYVWYFEIPAVVDQQIEGMERERVKLVVWQPPQAGNWYDLGTYQPTRLVEYIRSHYQKQSVEKGVEFWIRQD